MPSRAKRAVADWREAPVSRTRSTLARAGAWAYLQAFSALLLLLYGALRSIETLIPVGPLANGALTRPIDRFVLEWFGDVFVLLGVPAQAASVRGRLAGRIRDLMDAACDQIVVIAHSGGAIVAWTTLVDASSKELRVDSLVTIGEGLNLGWNITSGDVEGRRAPGVLERARQRFRLLYVPLLSQRQTLRWVDYWASRDPASSGPISPPDQDLVPPEDRFTNLSIWNRLSFRQDHGGYWDNDEEFVIPLLRRLEGDRGAGASFFGSIESHERRSIRRRRRVSVLSVWSQLCLMAPVAAIITSFVAGNDLVPRIGDAIASAWAVVPGNQLISEPLNAVRGLHLETIGPIDTLAEVGVWVVAALFLVVTVFALISPPERSAPWQGVQEGSLRVIEVLVRHGPVLAGVPLLVLAGTAAARFAGGATAAGLAAVSDALPWIAAGLALAVAVALLSPRFPWIRIAATAVILALGTYALIAPIVGIIVFADVGRMALGSVAIIAGFAILSRIGTWRWTAWDLRERLASHARTPVFGGVGLVAIQSVILLVSLALYFLAVGFALGIVALIATALVLAAVFVGIAIDVNHAPPGEGTQERTKFEGFTMQRRL